MIARPLLAALVLCATACGDNSSHDVGPDGGQPADAGPPGDAAQLRGATAFAVATDFFSTGVASTVSLPSLDLTVGAVAEVASTDPVVRYQDGRLYVINRYGQDNVTALDADTLQLIEQISTGPGTNPQDVAADGDLLYVATLGGDGLAVVDLSDPGAGVIDDIDLSGLDPVDDVPNCHTLVRVDRTLVVICGVLDDDNFLSPRGRGKAAIVDLDEGVVTGTFRLTQERPFGFALATPRGDVLVPSVPDFGDLTEGCVERVRLDGPDGPEAAGCLIDNADLGGFVSAMSYDAIGGRLWMTVTTSFDPDDFGPHGDAVAWDPLRHQLGAPATGPDVRPMDIAVCPTGHIVVSDATRGVRVYAPGGSPELTGDPLDVGLPPVSNGLVCY